MRCQCGEGYLRKDLNWPPLKVNQRPAPKNVPTKFTKVLPALNSRKYQLPVKGQYHSDAAAGPSCQEQEVKIIPGLAALQAAQMQSGSIKRGIVTKWEGMGDGVGWIKNTEREEERECLLRGELLQEGGEVVNWQTLVGRRLHYSSKRRGKRLEATKVFWLENLVQDGDSTCHTVGRVTHWVPDQVAGVIETSNGDVMVSRADFIPGGFVADIVGRQVRFRLDSVRMEAKNVQCLDRGSRMDESNVEENDGVLSVGGGQVQTFQAVEQRGGGREFTKSLQVDWDNPAVAWAVAASDDPLDLTDQQVGELLLELTPHMPALALHSTGHRTLTQLLGLAPIIDQPEKIMEMVAESLGDHFVSLALSPHGSKVLVAAFSVFVPRAAQLLATRYQDPEVSNLWRLMTLPNSARVFAAAMPHFSATLIRGLLATLGPLLGSLPYHPSLELVARQAAAVDTSLAVELAIWLDSAQLLLNPTYAPLLRCLVNLSLPKISAIFLNRLSGRLCAVTQVEIRNGIGRAKFYITVVQEGFGVELVGRLLLNGSDFQQELIMEELMQVIKCSLALA